MTSILTENFHSEEETAASSYVGNHTAILAAILRPDFLYLQVLTPCQLLDTTTQLIQQKERKDRIRKSKRRSILLIVDDFFEFTFCTCSLVSPLYHSMCGGGSLSARHSRVRWPLTGTVNVLTSLEPRSVGGTATQPLTIKIYVIHNNSKKRKVKEKKALWAWSAPSGRAW